MMAGQDDGERRAGRKGEKWQNRSSKLSLKKKFSVGCRNTELPFAKNVIFAADGARWPAGAQQASAGDCKGHQPAGQRRRLQKRISAAQQMEPQPGQAEKWPKNRFLIRVELRKGR